MALKLETKITVGTTLQMTPQLYQALNILQLNTVDLSELIQTELAENPMLVEKEEDDTKEIQPATEVSSEERNNSDKEQTTEVTADENGLSPDGIEKEDWDKFFPDDDYIIPRYDREQYADYREPQIAEQQTLAESLLWQLRMADVNDKEHGVGEIIIGNLNDHGFLTTSLEEIAEQSSSSIEEVRHVLGQIQTLDPVGIGAENVIECLLIQLQNLPQRNFLAERIVEQHFELLEKRQLDQLAKAMKSNHKDIIQADKIIAGLDPFPGRHFSNARIQYVIPDAFLK